MMPKGVEHVLEQTQSQIVLAVFHSLMPKGVEHEAQQMPTFEEWVVFHSLMPKGVEHAARNRASCCLPMGVSFVDAERR